MEIGEAITLLAGELKADPYCGNKKVAQSGKAIIDGIKGGEGKPEILRRKMLAARMTEPKAATVRARGWDLFSCDGDTFPYQSHHLVPEKQLPKHAVTAFLTDSPKVKHPTYKLEADTNYDTNGAKNGYFLPFAATTHQWNSATSPQKKSDICFEMMRRTKLQLHQGPHSRRDYLEEVDIETAGYKKMVSTFLEMIYDRGTLHVTGCDICKKPGTPIEIQPLEAIVDQVNRAAKLLELLMVSHRIFVSKRAAAYFDENRLGCMVHHKATAFVQNDPP